MKRENRLTSKCQPNTRKESQSTRNRTIVESGRKLKDDIPRKAIQKKAKKQCKLGETYDGASNAHQTAQHNKWIAGRKSNKEWRGGKTANINAHQYIGYNQLMAQKAEFQKTTMKQMTKFSKEEKKRKRKRSIHNSDLDYSDSEWSGGSNYSSKIILPRPKKMIVSNLN